jgi:hypothetical protein
VLARSVTHALVGIEPRTVEVEAHLQRGIPSFAIVGLADRACQEAKQRVRSGISSAELEWPSDRRIIVNLAPAGLRKEGSGFDLPIALAVLAASNQVPPRSLDGHAAFGELALDGRLRPVPGALVAAEGARRSGLTHLVCAAESGAEVALAGIEPIGVRHLAEAVAYLRGERGPPDVGRLADERGTPAGGPDLADVRGQAQARRALEIAAAGAHHLLFVGPPGCGKTHLARATAGEIKAGFIAVGINEVLDMWIGASERNLHDIFENARSHKPCVLFFDEVDALGASRSDMRQSAARQLINQFLAELDGVQSSNEGVLILAATNAPWHLDSAFRRPGRFDRILFVPPPDDAARGAILRILCKGKPVDEIDYDHLGRKMEDFSGADLKGVVDQAVEGKLREAMREGVPRPLTTRDLLAASGQMRPSTKEWFATARNYALYSNQGGIYDDILKHLKL